MTPTEVRNGLAAALATVPGLMASARRQRNIQPPHAVVGLPTVDYDATMARGADAMSCQVTIYVASVDDDMSDEIADQFVAGSGGRSVKTILEDVDLTGFKDANSQPTAMVRVRRAQVGTASLPDSGDFITALFDVDVVSEPS